jgi:uncharacterized integral membrane protein
MLLVPCRVPETFIKNLAILAGILCLCVILAGMALQTVDPGELFSLLSGSMYGSLGLMLGILGFFGFGMLLVIYLVFRTFWYRH